VFELARELEIPILAHLSFYAPFNSIWVGESAEMLLYQTVLLTYHL